MKPVYISGGEGFAPSEIKAALDEVRRSMGLPGDIVLFGVPVDQLESEESVKIENIGKIPAKKTVNAAAPSKIDNKIIQFPPVGKKSILNVIANPTETTQSADSDLMDEIKITNDAFGMGGADDDMEEVVDTGESQVEAEDDASITALFKGLPPLAEESADARPSLAQEFGAYLDKDEDEPAPKKAKPFGRKKKSAFNNVLGDLFSFAGMAANDDAEEFKLPDFIKRP